MNIDIATHLYSILSQDIDLAAIVGSNIYPVVADEDARVPYIVYQRVSNQPENAHDGYGDLSTARYQVRGYSKDFPSIDAIRTRLTGLLNAYDAEVNGRRITCRLIDDDEEHDEQTGFKTVRMDFLVSF